MAMTVNNGDGRKTQMEKPSEEYHGTEFELLLESMNAKQTFTDLDAVGRAHLLGLLQGIELAKNMNLADWDLRAPFFSMNN